MLSGKMRGVAQGILFSLTISNSTIGVVLCNSRVTCHLTIILIVIVSLTTHVAHESLLCRTDRADESRNTTAFAMEALDLKLSKFDVEVRDKVFKDVSALSHEFGCLLISQDFFNILIGALKVREQENEDLLGVTRDLDQVNDIIDLMEIPVEHLPTEFDTDIVIANVHGRWSLLGYDVDFVGSSTIDIFLA